MAMKEIISKKLIVLAKKHKETEEDFIAEICEADAQNLIVEYCKKQDYR